MLSLPVRKTVWGNVNTIEDLEKAINKSGQPFGVDWSGPACNYDPSFPCDKTYYQYLNFNPPSNLHAGIDIPCASGTEVYAVADGKVVQIESVTTKGLGIVVYHEKLRLKSLYWHLKDIPVTLGQSIQGGAFLAHSDNTGYSAGNHLHLEFKITDEHGISIKSVDPIPYFKDENMTLTKEQIHRLYALWGLNDPVGEAYWEGKTLDQLLEARKKDVLNNLNNS